MIDYSNVEHQVFTAGGGINITIKEYIYKSSIAGKKLYIQSGLHGGEISQWCLSRLHDYLMKNLQCGEVHIVPYANPLAWMQRAYFSTMGKFNFLDGKDFNRTFPGRHDGDTQARICAVLMDLAKKSDFVLDLHTSKNSNPFAIYTKSIYIHWIKTCGLKYNQFSDDASIPSLQGTFNAALDKLGIENICIECGGHDEFVEEKVTQVYNGILGIIGKLALSKHESFQSSEIYSFDTRHKVFSPIGGLLQIDKKIGSFLSQGEIIGRILSSRDLATVFEVISPVNGILHTTFPGHIVWEGDTLIEVVPDSNLTKL